LALIDRFGANGKFMSDLEANIHSFVWSGSLVPYFEQFQGPLRALSAHRHLAVRTWAAHTLDELNQRIRREQNRSAEVKVGLY
jgi:hypothetical protein